VEWKAFIKSFVKEIAVEGEEAVLRYTLPLPPDGTESEALLHQVLAFVLLVGQSLVGIEEAEWVLSLSASTMNYLIKKFPG